MGAAGQEDAVRDQPSGDLFYMLKRSLVLSGESVLDGT
jgi:hypothetical protein